MDNLILAIINLKTWFVGTHLWTTWMDISFIVSWMYVAFAITIFWINLVWIIPLSFGVGGKKAKNNSPWALPKPIDAPAYGLQKRCFFFPTVLQGIHFMTLRQFLAVILLWYEDIGFFGWYVSADV